MNDASVYSFCIVAAAFLWSFSAIRLASSDETTGYADLTETVALGRPFAVGMLYDKRRNLLLPSLSLWDAEYLEGKVKLIEAPSTSFDVTVDNSLKAKAYLLGVKADLTISIASGIVKLDGAATFLNNVANNDLITRLILSHKKTSHYKYLDIGDALNTTHLEYFVNGHGKGEATHVITEVLYGANAFFFLDFTVQNLTEIMEIMGKLEIGVNIAKVLELSGKAEVHYNDTNATSTLNLECSFVGDYVLPANPSTLDEALKIFRNLGEIYKKFGGVPVSAKLTPISRYTHAVDAILYEIDASIVEQVTALLDGITRLDQKIQSLIVNDTTAHFPRILQTAREFKDILMSLRNQFQLEIAPLLPKVRTGIAESKEILKILESIAESPFKISEMDRWVEIKKKQIGLLSMQQKYFTIIDDPNPDRSIPFHTTYAQMVAEINNYKYEYIVALFYHVEEMHDEFIDDLRCRLDNMQKLSETPTLGNKRMSYEMSEFDKWVDDQKLIRDLATKQYRFYHFCRENKKIKCFLYSDKPDAGQTKPSIDIFLFDHGEKKVFDTPTEPRKLSVKADQRFVVTWEKPAYGSEYVTEYLVRYRPITTLNHSYVPWFEEKVPPTALTHTINCLTEDVAHLLTVRAQTVAGHTRDRLILCFARGLEKSRLVRGNLSDVIIEDMKACKIRKRNAVLDETVGAIEMTTAVAAQPTPLAQPTLRCLVIKIDKMENDGKD